MRLFEESLLFEECFVEIRVESVEKIKGSAEMEEAEVVEKGIFLDYEKSRYQS